jgi:hypothetical protein
MPAVYKQIFLRVDIHLYCFENRWFIFALPLTKYMGLRPFEQSSYLCAVIGIAEMLCAMKRVFHISTENASGIVCYTSVYYIRFFLFLNLPPIITNSSLY